MSSLTNVNVQSKTMNGLNIIDADEISTGSFSTTNLYSENLNVTGTVSLPAASILDAYLSNNVALKDATNTFTAQQTFTGGFVATASQTIDFGSNAPIMSGVNITGLSSGFVDLTTNQTVGGVKTFTNNLRASATTGDVFQAYKNSGVGNAGHVLINDLGNLLYYDSTALATKWKLDDLGKLMIDDIDISGTMINKTTGAGDFIRSNSDATNYFYASNGGNIGFANSASNIGVNWYINANGNARFKSSTNSFKYWDINSNTFRYYNLGGTDSISMNGDVGNINITGTFSGNINYGTTVMRVGTTGTYSAKSIAIGPTLLGNGAPNCVAIGDSALNAATTTNGNSVAIGVNSLKLATGDRNTAIGSDSLPLLTGTSNGANTAIGNLTGTKLTSGTTNLFLGLGSGSGVTQGVNNLIVGSSMFASVSPDTGTAINNNVCVGSNCMGYIKNNMSNNCAIGSYALYSEAGYGGFATVAIGPNAGVRSLGSNCTFIGDNATVSPANSNFARSMGLGYNATVTASDQVVIATASQNTIIPGTLRVDGLIGSGVTTTFGGDIDTGLNDIYTDVLVAEAINTTLGVDISDGNNGVIQFSGGAQKIRIGTTTTVDATPNGIVIGNGSTSLGSCITIGGGSFSTTPVRGTGSIIIGNICEALGNYSVNIGHNAISVQNGVCIGRQARAGSNVAHTEGIAIGREALSGTQAVSIGANNQANAQDAISIGKTALANGQGAISVGAYAQSNGIKSIACGYNATANFDNAVSIGDTVQCSTTNEFRIGNASHKMLFKQLFYPFEVSPTNVTATGLLPGGTPYYGIYRLASAGAVTITLPTIVAGMEGMIITFRKSTTPLASGISVTCSVGNTYLPFNSVTVTAAGVVTALIGGGQSLARVMVISPTQWAVCT